MMTLEEIKEKLREEDIIDLIETLQITTDHIVERFEDFIEEQADDLEKEYEEEERLLFGDGEDLI